MKIEQELSKYLKETKSKFQLGSNEFYARKALSLALVSLKEGNYGIGAVLLQVTPTQINEFYGRNKLITGVGEERIIGHAETMAAVSFSKKQTPDESYAREITSQTANLPEGLICYGTLEPCPMCAVVLTNLGLIKSISTVLDGELISEDGVKLSNGAATVIGEKHKIQPKIWQIIQAARGLAFSQLETKDNNLVSLSERVFTETREEIDKSLSQRK